MREGLVNKTTNPAESRRGGLRNDAVANRLRILDAAREALAVSANASVQSIAKAAGVGQGTMYRHFPNREALILAVHRNDVSELVESAPRLVATLPASAALREWFTQLAAYGRIKHGLGEALYSATRQTLSDEGYASILQAIDALLDAGKRDGTVRTDIDAQDLLLLVGFLWRIDPTDDRERRSTRLLTLVLDAVSPPADRRQEPTAVR
ncbi:TetR family transcriptional regulator [Glaciihabitans sp. UYNi722]|uniref:TetR/AcrR family transcriptional regulator n=1 Tax=Glaciihabitans sp. UYNi722 TaxID=3156344 RepID=UPI00339600CD